MSQIEPYIPQGGLARDARRTARTVSRYQGQGQTAVAALDVATDTALAKVDNATAATGHAMGAVVRVAQAQKQLELMAPEASGRLNLIADDHAMSVVEILADHRRAMRRW